MPRLVMLPSSQSTGCSRGASGLAEQSPRCVQLGNRACPGQAQNRTELSKARVWRAQFLLLETPGWKRGAGGVSADKGVHVPLEPLFPSQEPFPGLATP